MVVQAEDLIQTWEARLGPLKNLRSNLYGPGGRLEGVRKIANGKKSGVHDKVDGRRSVREDVRKMMGGEKDYTQDNDSVRSKLPEARKDVLTLCRMPNPLGRLMCCTLTHLIDRAHLNSQLESKSSRLSLSL